MVLTADDFDSL